MPLEGCPLPENTDSPTDKKENPFKDIDTGPTKNDLVNSFLIDLGLTENEYAQFAREEDDPYALKMIAESGERDLLINLGENPNIDLQFVECHATRDYFPFLESLAISTKNPEIAEFLLQNEILNQWLFVGGLKGSRTMEGSRLLAVIRRYE